MQDNIVNMALLLVFMHIQERVAFTAATKAAVKMLSDGIRMDTIANGY